MLRDLFLRVRRYALKMLVPEFIWPRFVDVGGVSIRLRGAPYTFAIKRLLAKDPDSYERAERGLLHMLKPDDHVLELGSSIGVLTALICERVVDGRVVSVEASKLLIDYSGSWLKRYEQLSLINAAAFPIYDSIDLNLSFNDSSGSLGGIVDYSGTDSSESKLDSFFIKNAEEIEGFSPNVLVIDIEGSEDIILQEKMNLPGSIDRILIELHSFIYGEDVEKNIVDTILQEGFTLTQRVESVHMFSR